jgi:hypothetical protein
MDTNITKETDLKIWEIHKYKLQTKESKWAQKEDSETCKKS